jgi:hypothetical protein
VKINTAVEKVPEALFVKGNADGKLPEIEFVETSWFVRPGEVIAFEVIALIRFTGADGIAVSWTFWRLTGLLID